MFLGRPEGFPLLYWIWESSFAEILMIVFSLFKETAVGRCFL